jgi:hypothetical protein
MTEETPSHEALARPPAGEQPGWRQLRADVETTLAAARRPDDRQGKSARKE